MPDLDIVSMQQCKSFNQQTYSERDYIQTKVLTTDPSCTCKSFKFSKLPKWCKHLQTITNKVQTGEICTWHEQSSMQVQSKEQEDQMICPSCGGETEWVRVGV